MQTLLDHIFEGRCPDEIDGWDSRDPACAACWRLDELPRILDILRDTATPRPCGVDHAIDRLADVLDPARNAAGATP